MGFSSSYLSGAADLVGAAGDIYSIFRKPEARPLDPSQYGHRTLITTPGYNFGGGALTRRGGPADARAGLQGLQGKIQGLQGEVRPGFGRLTESGVQAIRQKAAEASGNLRANLARRGLAGASFASDLQTRLDAEYGQLENQFRTQAFQEEMAAEGALIDQQAQNFASLLDQDFRELGLATTFLSGVKQQAVKQADIARATKREELLGKYQAAPVAQAARAPVGAGPKPAPRPMVPAPRPAALPANAWRAR
jgi:hypothetical protein